MRAITLAMVLLAGPAMAGSIEEPNKAIETAKEKIIVPSKDSPAFKAFLESQRNYKYVPPPRPQYVPRESAPPVVILEAPRLHIDVPPIEPAPQPSNGVMCFRSENITNYF
jgi:hypothetical protein